MAADETSVSHDVSILNQISRLESSNFDDFWQESNEVRGLVNCKAICMGSHSGKQNVVTGCCLLIAEGTSFH